MRRTILARCVDATRRWLALPVIVAGVACSSPDLSGPVSKDATQLFWAIALNTHAITMSTVAPYDTLQLTATPLSAAGTPLAGAPAPIFTTSDSSVRVSPTGLLIARAVRGEVRVMATLTYQGIRLADTAVINVTSAVSPQTFTHLAFSLFPEDSATIAAPYRFSQFYFPPRKIVQAEARDASGAQIPEAIIALRSGDFRRATVQSPASSGTAEIDIVNGGLFSGPGPVTVYASATVYGVTLQDSLRLTITTPLFDLFQILDSLPPGASTPVPNLGASVLTVGVGGIVWWVNQSSDSMDVVFDDSTAVTPVGGFLDTGGGNIPVFPGTPGQFDPSSIRARKFPRVGTFHFHSTRVPNISGFITVQ